MKSKIFTLILVILVMQFSKSEKIFAQMFWNQACSFAGTNSSYITVPNTFTDNITYSFTLEAWVNPNIYNGFSKGVISKGGTLGAAKYYAMRLQSTGRFDIWTNGILRLTSKSSCPLHQWSHIAATLNASTGLFTLYFNGNMDTSVIIGGNVNPPTNTDSLYIGIAGVNTPFNGMVDEVRIWNRTLASYEIARARRISLGTNGGDYNGLILSMTFQKENSSGTRFTLYDWSNNGNNGVNNGVAAVNLSDQPSKTICISTCVRFNGADNYLAGADNPYISPTTGTTLQAWIFPESNSDATIIHKGSPSGTTTNYSLNIINRKLAAKINGGIYDSQDTIPLNEWSHVAFTYFFDGLRRTYSFSVNGKLVKGNSLNGGGYITDGTDSLYIGGTIGLPDFLGNIDEVRISRYAKTESDLNDSLFIPMESGSAIPGATVAYNFDGYTYCNTLLGPFLYFRNSTTLFVSSNAGFFDPLSPLDKTYSQNFQKGFYLKTSDRRIPESGTIGFMKEDTLNISLDENISDINLYVALTHTNISNVEIDLVSPINSTVRILNPTAFITGNDNIITIFDDQASTAQGISMFTSYSPTIQPFSNLGSVFNGLNSKGSWILVIRDQSNLDTGRLYSWGIQFNNKSSLPKLVSCKSLIQGFYNSSSNTMVQDTVRGYIRNTFSPYSVLDSSKAYLQPDGSGLFSFSESSIRKGFNYYLQLKHRNSIETWSNTAGVNFQPLTSQATYDFTSDSTKAFGNNLVRVDSSPIEFAIYSGDVNQDGIIDVSDVSLIFNDAALSVSGYANTDITGDGFVDISDLSIAFNNAKNSVSVIMPLQQ